MWLRSKAQDEQKTQHGEPGADETYSRQDECKTCCDTNEVYLLTYRLLNIMLHRWGVFLKVTINTANLTIYCLPAVCFFLIAPFPTSSR